MHHRGGLITTGLACALGLWLGACFDEPSNQTCNTGELGCMCMPDGTCLSGLTCMGTVCVAGEGDSETGDGDGDSTGDGDPTGDGDGDPTGDGDGDPTGDGDGDPTGDGDPSGDGDPTGDGDGDPDGVDPDGPYGDCKPDMQECLDNGGDPDFGCFTWSDGQLEGAVCPMSCESNPCPEPAPGFQAECQLLFGQPICVLLCETNNDCPSPLLCAPFGTGLCMWPG